MSPRLILPLAIFGASLLPATAQEELLGRRADVIPAQAELVYEKGMQFLAKSQTAQGNWSNGSGNDPGVVGLCIKAFLAHGEDPVNGPYSRNIQKAVSYIISQQNEANGYIGNSMYNHAFATTALAEVYGMIPDLPTNRLLRVTCSA